MIHMNLRAKILSGYVIVTILFVFVIIISFYQFMSLGNRLRFLKDEVASGVIIANGIRSEILSMRTAVEKFIYLNRDQDKKKAEEHIDNVLSLLKEAKKCIIKKDQLVKLKSIEDTSYEFIDKFKKVAIRIIARNNTKKELIATGKTIETKLDNLIKNYQEGYELSALNTCLNSLKKFIAAELEVNRFLLEIDSSYSKKALVVLDEIITELERFDIKSFENLMYAVEDYMDTFEGLASVILKMDNEINKTILPLAPKIVSLSSEVAEQGWKTMEQFSLDVEKNVRNTGRLMLSVGILAVLLGFTMGLVLARLIIKPIIKVVDFAAKVSEGDISKPLEIEQKDEIGQMAEALNNILIDMLSTQKKLMNNLDKLPTPVMEIDKDYNIVNINKEGARVMNIKPEDMVGKKCYDFYSSAHCQKSECALKKAMELDSLITSETVVSPDTLNMPIRYTGFPIKNSKKEIIGAVKYVLDISGERKINAEIKKLIKDVQAGNLETRGDSSGFIGSYAELINNANGILEALLKPLKESQDVLSKMAEGDLSNRMEGNYQGDHAMMKNSINNVLDSFNSILHQVGQAAEDVAASSAELASFSQSLSEGSQEQAASVEQISASIHEADQQINMNADNASSANILADETTQAALSGKEEMSKMISSMEEISKSSKNISKVINVINDIASQTNILALNATVEAVRAGQYGKSFAVIAQEVRNLAGRSAQAVKETSEMIDTSNKRVNEGVNIAERTNVALEKIVENIVKVRDLVEEINIASKEQAVAMGQLNDGMGQISSATQNMSTRSEETAGSAVQLRSLANELKKQISKFKLSEKIADYKMTDWRMEDEKSQIKETEQKTEEKIEENIDEKWSNLDDIIPLDADERGFNGF